MLKDILVFCMRAANYGIEIDEDGGTYTQLLIFNNNTIAHLVDIRIIYSNMYQIIKWTMEQLHKLLKDKTT